MEQHWERLWASVRGTYRPGHPLWPEGRESGHKGYVGELFHSLTNIWIEGLRSAGVYDRFNKEGKGWLPWLGL